MSIEIRPISAEATHALRHSVLRPHQPPASLRLPGDAHVDALHLGAVDGEAVVAIGSIHPEGREGGESPGYRIRGMATAPTHRGQGLGRKVLLGLVHHARRRGGAEVWCNARTGALTLYAREGFSAVTEVFEIEGIGPHVVMVKSCRA